MHVVAAPAERIAEPIRDILEAQNKIAQQMKEVCEAVSTITNGILIVRTPIINIFTPQEVSSVSSSPVTPVFTNSDPKIATKLLPKPRRKEYLSLVAVEIENNGFKIDDEYIRGMTRNSKPGKLFELMINPDQAGKLPDKITFRTLGISQGDYRALGFVLRDLKEILESNKLELDMERSRAISRYIVNGIIKRIRNRKKFKRLANTNQIN